MKCQIMFNEKKYDEKVKLSRGCYVTGEEIAILGSVTTDGYDVS